MTQRLGNINGPKLQNFEALKYQTYPNLFRWTTNLKSFMAYLRTVKEIIAINFNEISNIQYTWIALSFETKISTNSFIMNFQQIRLEHLNTVLSHSNISFMPEKGKARLRALLNRGRSKCLEKILLGFNLNSWNSFSTCNVHVILN